MELSNEAKNAILNFVSHAAWATSDGETYYNALAEAFFPVVSISAVYTQSETVTPYTDLDSLRSDLVVTAHYEGGASETVISYTLDGVLSVGTSVITVSFAGKTTTFNVTVSAPEWIIVARLSSSDLSQVGLTNNQPTYVQTRNDRVAYDGFIDVTGYDGYKYKVEWTTTASNTVTYGINSYNGSAMTAVSNHNNLSTSNTQAHGWYESGTQFTMESLLNNQAITHIRINFSCGSANTTAITPSQIDNVVIYAKSAE